MTPRLVLFPGLGADARMFEGQRGLPLEVEVPAWITPARREALASYAGRLAGTIRGVGPVWLAGVSFGGMVAMEVAKHLKCEGVILISSCRSGEGLPWLARAMGPMGWWVPAWAAHLAKRGAGPVRWVFGAATGEQVRLFRAMLRDTPPAFLHWSMCTAATWRGAGDVGVPVYQIHGSNDRVIPCPAAGVDDIVRGAGHLMCMTHADRVNQFLVTSVTKGGGTF